MHWAYNVPSFASSAFGLIAYAIYAHRTHRRAMLAVVAAGAACSAGHLALRIAGAEHLLTALAQLATNLAAAVMFRMLRTAFQAETPPEMPAARVV